MVKVSWVHENSMIFLIHCSSMCTDRMTSRNIVCRHLQGFKASKMSTYNIADCEGPDICFGFITDYNFKMTSPIICTGPS